MRSRTSTAGRAKRVDVDVDGGLAIFRRLGWSARDAVAFVAGTVAAVAILINVLFMQSGTHPAPMFKGAAVPGKAAAVAESAPAARPRPAEPAAGPALASTSSAPAPAPTKAAAPPALRTPGEIITDIQRELARRGYYDGTIDGLYGPRTDAAIRDFEQGAGLRPSTEANEALLQSIVRAPARLAKGITGATPAPRPPLPVRNDAARGDATRGDPVRNDAVRNDLVRNDVPERPAPSKRVIALQRALADYGYGQIKPSGFIDAETQAAIEKFERERKLPITGQASDRVVRELAAMTGRPLE